MFSHVSASVSHFLWVFPMFPFVFLPVSCVRSYGFSFCLIGASSGIGEAIAYLFSKCGASLAITGRKKDNLEKVSKKCKESSQSKLEVSSSCSINVTVSLQF